MKILNTNSREYLLLAILLTLCIAGRTQTVEQVRDEIQRQGIEHPEIVLAQAMEETGYLKCGQCSKRFNNLFGMRLKRLERPGNINGYIVYPNWVESIRAYKRWQDRRYTGGNYFEFLVSINYATNPKYISNLKWHVRHLAK